MAEENKKDTSTHTNSQQQKSNQKVQSQQLELKLFSHVFWKKIREDLHMDIILEKKPLKKLKLYEIDPEDLYINLEEVAQWSQDNRILYNEIRENGYADFICNKEYIRQIYNEIFFDNLELEAFDVELQNFTKLQVLHASNNMIQAVENIPPSLKELYLFQNQITSVSNKLKGDNILFLGLGHNLLSDQCLIQISQGCPQLLSLDLCYNNFCAIDIALEQLQGMKKLRMLNLYGNPISMLQNYKKGLLHELEWLEYFDQSKIIKEDEKQKKKQNTGNEIMISSQLETNSPNKQVQQKPITPLQKQKSQDDLGNLNQFVVFENANNQNITSFAFKVNVATLENCEGFVLDKTVYTDFDKAPDRFQTCYWVSFQIFDQIITNKEKKFLFENAVKEDEKTRIDFELKVEQVLPITVEVRDFMRKGFIVALYKSEPIMEKPADSDEKKPKMHTDNFPLIQETLIGVCKVTTKDWLKLTDKRESQFKYQLFDKDVQKEPNFHFPLKNEEELLEKNKFFVDQLVRKQEEALKPVEPEPTGKKDAKKKEVKKPPPQQDKKAKGGKGAKEEPEKKVFPLLDWPLMKRDKVFVDEQNVYLAHKNLLLAIKIEI